MLRKYLKFIYNTIKLNKYDNYDHILSKNNDILNMLTIHQIGGVNDISNIIKHDTDTTIKLIDELENQNMQYREHIKEMTTKIHNLLNMLNVMHEQTKNHSVFQHYKMMVQMAELEGFIAMYGIKD